MVPRRLSAYSKAKASSPAFRKTLDTIRSSVVC